VNSPQRAATHPAATISTTAGCQPSKAETALARLGPGHPLVRVRPGRRAFGDGEEVDVLAPAADRVVQQVRVGPIQNWMAWGSGREGSFSTGTMPRKALVPE
jgi:hypothetical protein